LCIVGDAPTCVCNPVCEGRYKNAYNIIYDKNKNMLTMRKGKIMQQQNENKTA